MAVKKKAVAKKTVTKKTVAKKPVAKISSIITALLTKEHSIAVNVAEKSSIALDKASAVVSAAVDKAKAAADKAKQSKRLAQINAAVKAKERVIASKLEHQEVQLKVKLHEAVVKGHELKAIEMAKMIELKDKAVALFAEKWEKDYLKKLAIKETELIKRKAKAAIARRKAALAKKRAAKTKK